ncbi:hypothetical protein AB3X94_00980 [Paraburkholderia sp. BR10923]|uniref:hypothetical protein n=1 Tax=Paraburkholderia sp. BR10923 TaxID=3236992 RepID=UPI0034CE86B2
MTVKTTPATLTWMNPDLVLGRLIDVDPRIELTGAEQHSAGFQKILRAIDRATRGPDVHVTGMAFLDADGQRRMIVETDSGFGFVLPPRRHPR